MEYEGTDLVFTRRKDVVEELGQLEPAPVESVRLLAGNDGALQDERLEYGRGRG